VVVPSGDVAGGPPVAASAVLLTASGNAVKNLPRFSTASDLTLHYTYSCRAFGQSDNFSVTDNDPTNLNVYVNQIVKGRSDISSKTSTGSHVLSVNSECTWTIKETQP
jgi:hypothetical protein